MTTPLSSPPGGDRIAVIGLGYVGLPLAVALARRFDCIGIDIDSNRIAALKAGHDRPREGTPDPRADSGLRHSEWIEAAPDADRSQERRVGKSGSVRGGLGGGSGIKKK